MSNVVNSYRFGGAAPSGYLLDTYTAAGAYSLRKLKTGVTYGIRVWRNSDSSETYVELETSGSIDLNSTVSAGGTLGTWVGANNGKITTWYDQSGNSNDLTQTTTSVMPRLINSGVLETDGGLSTAYFDTVSWRVFKTGTGLLGISGTDARTFFIVSSTTTPSSSNFLVRTGSGISAEYNITSEYGLRVNGGNELYDASN